MFFLLLYPVGIFIDTLSNESPLTVMITRGIPNQKLLCEIVQLKYRYQTFSDSSTGFTKVAALEGKDGIKDSSGKNTAQYGSIVHFMSELMAYYG